MRGDCFYLTPFKVAACAAEARSRSEVFYNALAEVCNVLHAVRSAMLRFVARERNESCLGASALRAEALELIMVY